MKKKIKTVCLFRNGMVMVFDSRGDQICNEQGLHEQVVDRITNEAPDANFTYSDNMSSPSRDISLSEFKNWERVDEKA